MNTVSFCFKSFAAKLGEASLSLPYEINSFDLIVKDTGSTSIQAADSTAINGSITPTDKR